MTFPLDDLLAAFVLGFLAMILFAALLSRKTISHFLHVLLTEDEANIVWCWARVAGFVGLVSYIVFCAIDLVWNHNAFNPLTFGGGLAGVIGAGAGAIRLKGNL